MGATAGTGDRLEAGVKIGGGTPRAIHANATRRIDPDAPRETAARHTLGGIGPWLRLFLGISAGAVAIAVTLGLLVVLTTTAVQAQSLPRAQAGPGNSGMILMTSSGRPSRPACMCSGLAPGSRPCRMQSARRAIPRNHKMTFAKSS